MMDYEGGSQAPEPTSDESNDSSLGPERSSDGDHDENGGGGGDSHDNNGGSGGDSHEEHDDDNDNDSQDLPMNNWKEFDEDAIYQKKHVDPEMRQWVLTNDCCRIISNKFFNNPVDDQGICDLFPKNRTDDIVSSAPIGSVLR